MGYNLNPFTRKLDDVGAGGMADPGSNGILARTALNTTSARTITGTANQVTVTNGDGVSGNPTLSTPQDIHTGASPTFARVYVNGAAYIDGATAGQLNITGRIKNTVTLGDVWNWSGDGSGIVTDVRSDFDKTQSAIRGSIFNNQNSNRTNAIIGLDFQVKHSKGYTLGQQYGVFVENRLEAASAVTTNSYGAYTKILMTNQSGMGVTNHYGYYASGVDSQLSGGNTATVSNFYGLYMPGLGGTNVTYTNRYGVYIADGSAVNVLTTTQPLTDSTYTSGTSTKYWLAEYTDRLYLNSTAYADGATAGQFKITGLLMPVQATTAGAPAYVKGAMYFDTTLNKLRIGGATAWETVTSV